MRRQIIHTRRLLWFGTRRWRIRSFFVLDSTMMAALRQRRLDFMTHRFDFTTMVALRQRRFDFELDFTLRRFPLTDVRATHCEILTGVSPYSSNIKQLCLLFNCIGGLQFNSRFMSSSPLLGVEPCLEFIITTRFSRRTSR